MKTIIIAGQEKSGKTRVMTEWAKTDSNVIMFHAGPGGATTYGRKMKCITQALQQQKTTVIFDDVPKRQLFGFVLSINAIRQDVQEAAFMRVVITVCGSVLDLGIGNIRQDSLVIVDITPTSNIKLNWIADVRDLARI